MIQPVHIHDLFILAAGRFGEKISFRKRKGAEFRGFSFVDALSIVDRSAAGLLRIGLRRGDRILLICDPSPFWLMMDGAIISAGGVSVPRGTDTTDEEIVHISNHSESRFAIVQNQKTADRIRNLAPKLESLRYLIVMEDENGDPAVGRSSLSLLQQKGDKALAQKPDLIQTVNDLRDPTSLAALIYTSGTTGKPKGVILTEKAFVSAVLNIRKSFYSDSSDRGLSLLPPWHVYERLIEYFSLNNGIDYLITDISSLRDDLREFQPTLFPSVPRIWESVYNGIMGRVSKEPAVKQKIFRFCLSVGSAWAGNKAVFYGYNPAIEKPAWYARFVRGSFSLFALIFLFVPNLLARKVFSNIHAGLGGKLRVSVSGGGALPSYVDRFLTSVGISIIDGFGMTESCGIISVRSEKYPTPGTIGPPISGYEFKIVDEYGNDVSKKPGKKGVLWVRSDQLFSGYYKDPEYSDSQFDDDGYFNTGDIMMTNWRGQLIFSGRAKDTIVLSGGENIEPTPIEERLLESNYIDQVLVTGSDRKSLSTLIVPNIDRVRVDVPDAPESTMNWNSHLGVRSLIKREIARLVSKANGFKSFELIPPNHFCLLAAPFDPDREMTRTLKIKRNVVLQNYSAAVDAMYD